MKTLNAKLGYTIVQATLFICIAVAIPFHSANAGSSDWQQTNGPVGCNVLDMAVVDTVVYALINQSLMCKFPSEQAWRSLAPNNDNRYGGWQRFISVSSKSALLSTAQGYYDQIDQSSPTVTRTVHLASSEGGNRIIGALEKSCWTIIPDETYPLMYSDSEGKYWAIGLFPYQQAPHTINTMAMSSCGSCYLATDEGLYRCGGFSKEFRAFEISSYLPMVNIVAARGSVVCAGTKNGQLLCSVNDGLSWDEIPAAAAGSIEDIAITETACFALVHSSTDRNSYILQIDFAEKISRVALSSSIVNPYEEVRFTSLVARQNTLFLGTSMRGILVSDNAGQTWRRDNESIIETSPNRLVAIDTVLFAAVPASGIFRTFDKGDSWELLEGTESFAPHILHSMLAGEQTLFALAGNDHQTYIQRSMDLGNTWQEIQNPGDENRVDQIVYNSSSLLALGASIYRSNDNGTTWIPSIDGLEGESVQAIGSVGNQFLVSTHRPAFYRSDDNGQHWYKISDSPDGNPFYQIHSVNNIVFARSYTGTIFRSVDFGATWSELSYKYMDNFIIYDGVLYATDGDGTVVHSYTNGSSWTPVGIQANSIALIGNTLFAAHNKGTGVYRSESVLTSVRDQSIDKNRYTDTYPNPASVSATLRYSLPAPGRTIVAVSDVLGNTVATLDNGFEQAGEHSGQLDVSTLPAGVYYWHIQSGNMVLHGKLLVAR